MIPHEISKIAWFVGFVLLATSAPAAAQEHQPERTADVGTESHGHEYHPNEIAVFLGETDEEGHDSQFTYGIPLGGTWELAPAVNLDLVDGEKVWVYGANVAFGW